MIKLLFIAAGGAMGATCRYALSGWVQNRSEGVFPWGTLAVNALGCLLMGFLAPVLLERVRPEYRDMILIGALGAFTTWSSFGYETIRMFSEKAFSAAAFNVLLTNAVCLLAVWLGFRVMHRVLG